MILWVKGLLCKHEDLTLDPEHLPRNLAVVLDACDLSTKKQRQRDLWHLPDQASLANSASPGSVRIPVSNYVVDMPGI